MKRILGTFAAIALLVASPLLGSAATGSWSVVSSPNNGTVDNLLQSVTCVTPGDCWAVGYSDSSNPQALTEHWNGSAWSIVSSPSPGSATQLYDVSCSGSADCWAVGTYVSGVTQLGFAMHWNGTAWTDVSLPSVSGASGVGTTGVWCVTASDCWLVGSYDAAAGGVSTLVEHWNGSAWSIVTTPTPPSSPSNVLSSVTCVSASRCWAVGETVNKTLAEQWDGTAWTIVPSANLNPAPAGIDFDHLYRVTCVSTTDCWAVGAATGNNLSLSLILRWDGTNWTVSSAPSPGTGLNDNLDGVACQGANLCWATGGDDNGALIDKWNGSSWSVDPTTQSPSAVPGGDYLNGAACDSGRNCWAVGYTTNSVPLNQTLVEEYTSPVLASAPGPTPTPTPAPSASPTPTPTSSPVGIISAPNTGAAPGDSALASIGVGGVIAGAVLARRRWRC